MMDLTISEIARACGGQLVLNGRSAADSVSSVVLDSRKVEIGGVFVATVGERVDGHSFIPSVFGRGAYLVITEKTPGQVQLESGVPAEDWRSYLLVEDTLYALKNLAEYYRKKFDIPIVGITGSAGKTSTKEFVAGVLSEKYNVLKTEGNFNNEIGVPLTLLRLRKEHTAAVVEMGISEFGEMHRLSKMVRPDICVITNIGQCHLENLKSREGILKAKTEILDYMPENGQVLFWGGDDKLRELKEVCCGRCLDSQGKMTTPHYFGLGEIPEEEVWIQDITSQGLFGSNGLLCRKDEDGWVDKAFVHIPVPGMRMVINAAAAACVAGRLGLSLKEITRGLVGLKATQGRGQMTRVGGRVVIDDCYNANPISMKASLDNLAMADGAKVAILGDMFELGENSVEMHKEVGCYAAQSGADIILCVGDKAGKLYEAASDEAEEHFGEKPGSREQKICWFQSLEKLMKELEAHPLEYLPEGCTVLLKASHGMHFEEILEWMKKKSE